MRVAGAAVTAPGRGSNLTLICRRVGSARTG